LDSAEPFPHGAVEAGDLAQTLAGAPPFTSVRLWTDPREADASHRSEIRWKDLRRDLEARGAPDAALRSITDLVPAAHLEGDTLFVVADADAVRLVDHSDTREERDLGHLAPLPYLLPVIRSRQSAPPYVVVLTDRTGADLIGFRTGGPELAEKVRGETSVIHKVHAGGWSMRRYQQRAENTWEENAEDVAAAVEALVRRLEARLVVVAGDVRAVALLRRDLPADIDGLVRVIAGERARDRDPEDAVPAAADDLVAGLVRDEERRLLERAREERGQGDLFVEGAAATAGALARAQVAILLIAEVDPGASPTVWIGPDGTQLATTRADVTAMGVDEPVEAPAVDALARAAIATDALLRVTRDAGFADGVAALLRWKNDGLK
jgi:hypothetical protein